MFTRLTFGRGTIRSARFAPDGKTVVYGAAWDGNPIKVFFARTESSESTPLSFPPAEMLAVSGTGELALSLNHSFDGWMGDGTLARAPMLGAGPRPLVGNVREADWTPDGSELAIVRRVGGRERLELPLGQVLYETTGWIGSVRVSPDGQHVAFADHPVFADDIGTVSIVDRAGKKRDLSTGWDSMLRGLAWSPDGREVWFTASHGGEDSALRAVDLEGHVRPILSGLARVIVFDIAPDGRVLLGRETFERRVEALTPDCRAAARFLACRASNRCRATWRRTAGRSSSWISPRAGTRRISRRATVRRPCVSGRARGTRFRRTARGSRRSRRRRR